MRGRLVSEQGALCKRLLGQWGGRRIERLGGWLFRCRTGMQPDKTFVGIGELDKVGIMVAVDQFCPTAITAKEFIAQAVHVGYFSGQGVHKHIDQGHFATNVIEIGPIETQMPVDLCSR